MAEVIVLIAFAFILSVTLLIMLRNFLVFLLRHRLLDEEGIWLRLHSDEIVEGRRLPGLFERYRRLPSYTAMMLKFWKSTGSYERELGSIEQYYPLLKK